MDVINTPPSAIIIAFVPRRKRPRVCIAIRGDLVIESAIGFGASPANDFHALSAEDGAAP